MLDIDYYILAEPLKVQLLKQGIKLPNNIFKVIYLDFKAIQRFNIRRYISKAILSGLHNRLVKNIEHQFLISQKNKIRENRRRRNKRMLQTMTQAS